MRKIIDKKQYYIIWRKNAKVGLFSNIYIFFSQILFALNQALVPVIDMQNYDNIYLKPELLHKENSWEFFFEQPCKVGIKDIPIFSPKYMADGGDIVKEPFFSWTNLEWIMDKKKTEFYKDKYKKYIRLNSETIKYIDNITNTILPSNGKVLGILARGSDYTANEPLGHPIQPTQELIFEMVDRIMFEKKCSYIFLATEDENLQKNFKSRYGSKLLDREIFRVSTERGEQISDILEKAQVNRKLFGLNYLANIYILAKCDCFIGGKTSATPFVFLIKENEFEYFYIWELGIYGVNK